MKDKLGRGLAAIVILVIALAGGLLIALSPDIALPLSLMLLPGLIALALDRSPGCAVARAILLCQGAACVHPVLAAWYRCAGINGCMADLGEFSAILPVWIAAAFAWLLTQLLPLGLKMLEDYRLQLRRATLAARREALVEEWGLEKTAD